MCLSVCLNVCVLCFYEQNLFFFSTLYSTFRSFVSLFRQNFVLRNLNGFISGQVLGNVEKMYGYSSYLCLFCALSVYIYLSACACVWVCAKCDPFKRSDFNFWVFCLRFRHGMFFYSISINDLREDVKFGSTNEYQNPSDTTSVQEFFLFICLAFHMIKHFPSDPERWEKINLNFYFHTSLWCLKLSYQCTTKKR